MCGIAGKLYVDDSRPVEADALRRMADALRHRGPDDGGVWCEGAVGLAHRRLSVIDLTPAGRQPMANEDGTVRIVFNGEVYNFEALRPALEAAGHRFRSRTDTEVVLHLYEEHGVECLGLLRGMFAFAIWDGPRRQLFLARDRLGKKPLVYQADGETFRFASEAKAILQDPAVEARPDPAALARYLTYGYVPGRRSAFAGFRRVPPAHYLLWERGRTTLTRYWQLRRDGKRERPEAEWTEEIRARLQEAVRLRLASDVPLGAFLSGGIDSSAVVAMMAHGSVGAVRTFSIGFDEPEYDELQYARLVARHFGTEHHELVVKPDAAAILPRLAWHYDEPFGDSSAVATFCVAEMTRRHVTVALTGDGGDESFGGYERYAASALAHRLDRLPAGLRSLAASAGRALLPAAGRRTSPLVRGRRFLDALGEAPGQRYARWLCHFSDEGVAEVCTTAFLDAAGEGHGPEDLLAAHAAGGGDVVEAAMAADMQLYLPDDLLVKADIASMAHGLEVRSPFLDHELMEFAATIPSALKVRARHTKCILKRALHDLLPAPVLERPKKGFGVPIDHWLRGELRGLACETLLSSRAVGRGYFRPAVVRRLLDDHATGRANLRDPLWTLLMLELWHRAYIDADGELARRRRA
jgi:asparagine synthase (glutamine-hydrolysing)